MGWTSIYDDYLINKKTEGVRDYLVRNYERGGRLKVVDFSKKGSTVYMAINVVGTDEVFGEVVMTGFDGGEFLYKEVSESMGPYQVECPQRILKKLTPTDDKYAIEWRKRCWDFHKRNRNASKKYQHGDVLTFPNEIVFTDGFKGNQFILIKEGRRTLFASYREQTSMDRVYPEYRITKWRQSEPKVTGHVS